MDGWDGYQVGGKQCVTVPKMLNDTDTNFFRYRFRDIFLIPNFTNTGSETIFRYQICLIPVPIPLEKLKNSR